MSTENGNKICKVWIGPWGHYKCGDDNCGSGLVRNNSTFFCDLGIGGVSDNEEFETVLVSCKESKQGKVALVCASVSCLIGIFALFAKYIAWKNHAWIEKVCLMYASIVCALLAAASAIVGWYGWMKVVDDINTVLEATKNEDSKMTVYMFVNIIAIVILIISAVCDIMAEVGYDRKA